MKTQSTLWTVLRTLLVAATAVVYPAVARAATESPSELLEKGIYAEETKGDVDSAIAIYQQLVAEQDVNQSLAAQAQFRLGQCYLKKNQTADATAAFRKLIHDYPNETNLVAQARALLPNGLPLGPVPWVDGERLQLTVSLSTGSDIGVAEYRADLVHEVNGSNVWRVGCRMMAGGAQSVSSVDADPETFRPISSHWKHSLFGEVTASYKSGEVQIQRVGKGQPETVGVDGAVYDNEEAMHLIRRLPLTVGYKTTIPIYSPIGGSTVIPIGLEVLAKETIDVPAGKFDCFQVKLMPVNQTFWFSDDAHRYLAKFEAGPVLAELTSVTQRQPGESVSFHDAQTGVSFTAPADWVVWRAQHGQPDGQVLIRTLDPDADTYDGGMRLFATDSLSDAARKSARAWMDEDVQKNNTRKIRPDSWKDLTIDGRPAVSCIGDYTESGTPRVQYLLRVLGKTNSELFVVTTAPDKFDTVKAQFDTIVASYRTK
ncbi:MAG TPA: tetratricopeptide repeat protein [Verrucomicrobiae bacterium]|nr:tetratricopeptide repeat protein [Verrucomicrobiae bacterium]